jgi:hypothetical protein
VSEALRVIEHRDHGRRHPKYPDIRRCRHGGTSITTSSPL